MLLSLEIKSYNSSRKSNLSNLEGSQENIDYRDPLINDIYKGLDTNTKKKLLEDFPLSDPNNKNIHVGILKNIADHQIKSVWKCLSEEEQNRLDQKNIRDKYLFLRSEVNQLKKKQISAKTKTPSSSS